MKVLSLQALFRRLGIEKIQIGRENMNMIEIVRDIQGRKSAQIISPAEKGKAHRIQRPNKLFQIGHPAAPLRIHGRGLVAEDIRKNRRMISIHRDHMRPFFRKIPIQQRISHTERIRPAVRTDIHLQCGRHSDLITETEFMTGPGPIQLSPSCNPAVCLTHRPDESIWTP